MPDDVLFKMNEFNAALNHVKQITCIDNNISIKTNEKEETITFDELGIEHLLIQSTTVIDYKIVKRDDNDLIKKYMDEPYGFSDVKNAVIQLSKSIKNNPNDSKIKIESEDRILHCEYHILDEEKIPTGLIDCLFF